MAWLCRIIGHDKRLREYINSDEVWVCRRCGKRIRMTRDGPDTSGYTRWREVKDGKE